MESHKRGQSKKEIEDLLEEISKEELEDFEIEVRDEEKIEEGIVKLYYRLCKQEGILFTGKKEILEIYFDYGREFEERINLLLERERDDKITIISKIIDEIVKEGVNHNRRNIKRRSEKARKIYLILSSVGGKEKIKRLRKLKSEDYIRISFREIEEWKKSLEV